MSYNTSDKGGQQVRVGNWLEELKLKEETGIRYFPSPKDRTSTLMTTGRCITHSERMEPKDYKSVTQETIINPINHPEYKWQQLLHAGPRRSSVEQQLRARVAAEYDSKKAQDIKASLIVDYTSESKRNFSRRGFTPHIDEINSTSRLPMNPPKFVTETAISFYSDSIKRGESLSFPVTAVVTSNPFRKNNAFSVDVYKDHLAKRCESNERPMPLPSVKQFCEMNSLRSRLINHVRSSTPYGSNPGRSVREIIRVLWYSPEESTSGLIHVDKLGQMLEDYFNFPISKSESYCLLCAFDAGIDGYLLLVELSNFIRRVGNSKRIDLITSAFNVASSGTDEVYISEPDIRKRFQGNDAQTFFSDLQDIRNYSRVIAAATPKSAGRQSALGRARGNEFSIDDFFDYYIDIAAEVDDDFTFENMIRASWGF